MKTALFLVVLTLAPSGRAAMISITSTAWMRGFSWGSGDVFDLDAGTLVFDDRRLFDGSENLDTFARAGDLRVLSSSTDASVGGVPYRDGDLIGWNSAMGAASLFFSEDLFGADEDIDAVHAFADGTLALSTTSTANLGGLRFSSGDAIRYDPASGRAELLFEGSAWFDRPENLDALSVAGEDLLLSSSTDGHAGELTFRDSDVLSFDGEGLIPWLSESFFAGDEDIDALHVPQPVSEPSSLALMTCLPLLLAAHRMRRDTPTALSSKAHPELGMQS